MRENQMIKHARRIEIFPDRNQKELLRVAFDVYRYVYNTTATEINRRRESKERVNLTELRRKEVSDCVWKEVCKSSAWKVIPYCLRSSACEEVWHAFQAINARNRKAKEKGKKSQTEWKFKFRRKKDPIEGMRIEAAPLNRVGTKSLHGEFWKQLFGSRGN